MNYLDYEGKDIFENTEQDKLLNWLYTHGIGRLILKPLISPAFSRFMGKLLDTRLSALLVPKFIQYAGIDMSEYKNTHYRSYNDFFTRKIKEGCRPLAGDNTTLISPSDGRVSAYSITEDTTFSVKNTEYTLRALLRSRRLANRFRGGYAIIIRLTVDDYHRYVYAASGQKTKNYFIPGILHTVNPIANDYAPIYKENSREFTVIHTKEFGDIIQMEVGALMVGKITNHHEESSVYRGNEKGYFEFGGSTIIVLVKKDRLKIREDFLINTANDFETKIHQGDALGTQLF